MDFPELVHEAVPHRAAAFGQQLSTDGQRGRCRPVPGAPRPELGQYRHELDRGLGQAVRGPLPWACLRAGKQPGADQVPKALRENVGGDSLLRSGQQLPEVPAVAEHDVSQHQQAPAVTE
jgi:hypothetical protein